MSRADASSYRLSAGGRVDRDRRLAFTFNGRRYEGHPGDTLASALLANGVSLVARSFKYHRPRGIYAAGVEEPNALVQLETGAETLPNVPATTVELYDGLKAASVNCWPSVTFDVGAMVQAAAPMLPAGFYYKTFMAPGSWWPAYEHLIRRIAGLGEAPREPDPDIYDRMHAHCDVLVVGAGPAGLAAALAAGRAGARVILAEQQGAYGGRLLDERTTLDGAPASDWVTAVVAELETLAEVRLLPRTTAFGYYDQNYVALMECRPTGSATRERLWGVRARQVVLATGAIERPIVFANNDRPGVMLAGAARAYVNRYGVAPGRRVLVFTNNDDAYRTALDLTDAGVAVAAIVDVRSKPEGRMVDEAKTRGIEVAGGSAVVGTRGRQHVRAVELVSVDAAGATQSGPTRVIECDTIAVSGGWNPTVHLFSQSGGRLRFDDAKACFVPGAAAQALLCTGAANGDFASDACLEGGFAAGRAAAAGAGFTDAPPQKLPVVEPVAENPPQTFWSVRPPAGGKGPRGKRFIDIHNDVTVADVELAAREGYGKSEHTKRYTTLGMGPDQGKTGNIHGLAVLADLHGTSIPEVGTTTFRPPYTPVTLGALAGRDIGALADPARTTPMHDWHVRAGAAFEDVGQWKRPWYFPRPGESMHNAVNRECLAARNAVGILDATILGKIDIQGPDAAEFLNRVYTNAWSALGIGRCRYGLMCGEDGMVFDDGVTSRLGENRYLMTTTSGNAARVLAWLEEWLQTEWPHLRVYLNSVTETWATAAICGPQARPLLAQLTDIDLSPEGFPHMSVQNANVADLPARIFRVSFTGEVSFEINVPARYGLALWTTLMDAGAPYGITPFGTETMHVLRAEKGYIIVGQETDGTVTPIDLGMDWIVSKKKEFIGKRSFARTDTMRPDRKQLVGLLTEDSNEVLPEGAQIVPERRAQPPLPMIGHVTSSYYSANLGRSIALALVKSGRERMGQPVYVPTTAPGRTGTVTATVASPVFFDPDGTRMNA